MNKLTHIEAQLNQLIVAQETHNAEQRAMRRDIQSGADERKKLLQSVEKISRGLYGDPDNGYTGLVNSDMDQEKRLKSLEISRARVKWTLGGIAAAVQLTAIAIYEWVTKSFD